MSDYLWDKTGEPDEDVEQLENLLGALKYQPRPLDIPAHAMPTARTARPATQFFSRPRLAIAASLLLTLLAGTWFITRQGEPQQKQLAKAEQASDKFSSGRAQAGNVPNDAASNNVSVNDTATPKQRENSAVVVKVTTREKRNRTPRQPLARRHKALPRVDENTRAPRELIASNGGMRLEVEQPLTPQQREATEQLMLALRVASAKFNYAQREMQEIGRAGK